MLYMMAVFSGARQGEILGLKWSDVDWENSKSISRGLSLRTIFPTENQKIKP